MLLNIYEFTSFSARCEIHELTVRSRCTVVILRFEYVTVCMCVCSLCTRTCVCVLEYCFSIVRIAHIFIRFARSFIHSFAMYFSLSLAKRLFVVLVEMANTPMSM